MMAACWRGLQGQAQAAGRHLKSDTQDNIPHSTRPPLPKGMRRVPGGSGWPATARQWSSCCRRTSSRASAGESPGCASSSAAVVSELRLVSGSRRCASDRSTRAGLLAAAAGRAAVAAAAAPGGGAGFSKLAAASLLLVPLLLPKPRQMRSEPSALPPATLLPLLPAPCLSSHALRALISTHSATSSTANVAALPRPMCMAGICSVLFVGCCCAAAHRARARGRGASAACAPAPLIGPCIQSTQLTPHQCQAATAAASCSWPCLARHMTAVGGKRCQRCCVRASSSPLGRLRQATRWRRTKREPATI